MSESEPTPHPRHTQDVDDLDARLDVLEGWQDMVNNVLMPRVDELEDALEQRNDRIQSLEDRVHDLEAQLEMLDGLADSQASTPQKRAADLARAMVRQAQETADGRVSRYYKEVKQDLATLGHESIHDPQAYSAMDAVAEMTGFGKMTTTRDGQDVEAVYVNLDELDGQQYVNEINNGAGRPAAPDSHETETETT